jgi:hypothetical protein
MCSISIRHVCMLIIIIMFCIMQWQCLELLVSCICLFTFLVDDAVHWARRKWKNIWGPFCRSPHLKSWISLSMSSFEKLFLVPVKWENIIGSEWINIFPLNCEEKVCQMGFMIQSQASTFDYERNEKSNNFKL